MRDDRVRRTFLGMVFDVRLKSDPPKFLRGARISSEQGRIYPHPINDHPRTAAAAIPR
jgi:hypothetical protein